MPYIKIEERFKWDHWLTMMPAITTPGDRAYVIYRIAYQGRSYASLSTARAVLKDLYDIFTGMLLDYEAEKKVEHGDI